MMQCSEFWTETTPAPRAPTGRVPDIHGTVTPTCKSVHVLIKRSFSIAGHRTSVALEPEFWEALERCARRRGETLAALVLAVDAERVPARPLASALRVRALQEAAANRDS